MGGGNTEKTEQNEHVDKKMRLVAGVGTTSGACQIREAGGLGSPNKSGVLTMGIAFLSGRRC